jgi:pyruvate/2-oxoglutarate dehydrogenase complex dihydrolipoamide acyltransferase (E2) component
MTQPTHEEALLAVTQEDRDAAAAFYERHLWRPGEVPVAGEMRRGRIDESPLVQMLARHRLSTRAPSPAVGAVEAIDRADLRSAIDDLIAAASRRWGLGSPEHNFALAIGDAIARCPVIPSALAAQPAQGSGVPEGFVVVPRIMTAAMINAWSNGPTVTTDEIAARTPFQEGWTRVLSASPPPEAAAQGDG